MDTDKKVTTETNNELVKESGKEDLKETESKTRKEKESEAEEGLLSQIAPDKLRKLVRSYMELLKRSMTIAEIAIAQELPEDRIKELLIEITKRCTAAPIVDGRRAGF